LIDFQFSISQGIALEFGNFYMRVIVNGGFVTDQSAAITSASQSDPAVLSLNAVGFQVASATSIPQSVIASYNPLDQITLAGGTFTTPAVLSVTNTQIGSLGLNSPGTGGQYAPTNTVTLAGGTQSVAPTLEILETQVVAASVSNGGNGGQFGTWTGTGTTGTGTPFQALVFVGSTGQLVSVISITYGGAYTVNPTNLSSEYITGPHIPNNAAVSLRMGISSFTVTNPGVFTANPSGGNLTQASSSGSGTGATFNNAVMAPNTVSVATAGIYSTFPSNPVGQASTSGTGRGATFDVVTSPVAITPFNVGDWIAIEGVAGMTQLNGQTYVVGAATAGTVTLYDVYGNPINSTAFSAYISGGTASRIYTLPTIYSEVDLEYLKVAQSADVMSICCVNQITLTEYPPQDLTRSSDDSWAFSAVVPTQTIAPPTNTAASSSTSGSVDYAYVITSVNQTDGTESIASTAATISGGVDIANTAGTNTITWTPNSSTNEYNVYKATPGYTVPPPAGSLFGFAGTAYGGEFLDSNIVADFSQVPPQHQNPFARGQLLVPTITNGGSGSSFTYTINSVNGSGAVLTPIVVGNVLVGFIVVDPGQNYNAATDTITLSGGATATLNVGAQSGTYPGVPSYFQERRAYGYSLNNPDTYWMSQPGSFTNFDFRIPTIDTDAITGSPWAVEVNGIQWMLLMPAGLLVMTGLSAWLLVGAGSFATNVSPISPSSQDANPQAFTGCSPTVPPVKINYDVLYLTWEGSFYYDLPYQLYALSEPQDITQNSRHLFTGYTIREHAWCEQPFKLLWAVRDDGVLLSLTFLKSEQVAGWAHHDTQGMWQTVCSVKEPPNDALYLGAQRMFGTNTAYTIERMDNRVWTQTEDCWCVDCGLSLAQPTPNATLTASSASGLGSITGATNIVSGASYSAETTWSVSDNNGLGPGTGAVPTVTLNGTGGVATVTFAAGSQGQNYVNPVLVPNDPTGSGSGFSCSLTLNNAATFTASANVFGALSVGSFIRMGGGIAEITAYTSPTVVTANILMPIAVTTQGPSGSVVPQVAASGNWTLSAPVTEVFAPQFAGATVTGLADGNVITPQVVPANGTINLPNPATAVTIGLGFTAQLQSVYLDAGEPTVQGQRKKVSGVTLRLEQSLGMEVATNQIDGSTLSPSLEAVVWNSLSVVPTPPTAVPAAYNALCPTLYTGDSQFIPTQGGYQKPGQVAVQQTNPLPLNVLALIPNVLPGDLPDNAVKPRQQAQRR
jgi:hypothetical protein